MVKILKLSIPATLLLIVISASAQQMSVPAPNTSSEIIENYSLEANSFIDALLKISAQFRLPLGVEWVKTEDTLKPVRFSRTHATLEEVMQSVVFSHAGYDWRLEDGIVHVFDTALLRDARNPLNTKLKHFGFSDCRQMVAPEAEVYLEIGLRNVVEPKIGGGWGASIGRGVDEPKLQLPCDDVSVRYVLNRIIAVSRQHIWIATFPERMTLNPTGFLEELPMYPPDADLNQPFWILLRWENPPLENMVK